MLLSLPYTNTPKYYQDLSITSTTPFPSLLFTSPGGNFFRTLSLLPWSWYLQSGKFQVRQSPTMMREHSFKHTCCFVSISCSSPLWGLPLLSLQSKILGRHSRYVIIWSLSLSPMPSPTTTPSSTHAALLLVPQSLKGKSTTSIAASEAIHQKGYDTAIDLSSKS